MALTLAPRKITSNEQTLLRRDGQWCELFAAIDPAPTVYTAILNLASLPADNDEVAEINVTSGAFSGAYTTAHAGMSIWIGSTAGASDLGVARLRANITTTGSIAIKIGETSDIAWVVDPQVARYLTIVDEFRIWPRLLRTVGPTTTAISGKVSGAAGSQKVYGEAQNAGVYVYTQRNTTTVNLVRWPGFTYGYTDLFTAGDYVKLEVVNQIRKVVAVIDSDHMTIDTPFSAWPALDIAATYPVKTKFLTEVKPGDFINFGSLSGEVTQVVSDLELTLRSALGSGATGETATVTRLEIFMDYDVPVTDPDWGGANYHWTRPNPPVPVLGGPIVIDDFDGNARVIQLDASRSYEIDGSILLYQWSTTGGTLSSTSSATPTLTVTQAGVYRVTCVVYGHAGRPAYGHRKIYVFDKTHPPFTVLSLENAGGDVGSGGWSARLTVYGEYDRTQIRDQAQIVLFARDHYGATQQSIGQVANSANIVLVGWIVGETIAVDPELGAVSFEIQGTQFWLDRITGVATAMEDISTAPGLWTQMYQLTCDRALWHFFVWRTTLTLVCDLHLTGDTRRLKFLEGKLGSLASQVDQFSTQVIVARAASDHIGRVIVEIDPQFIPAASRTTPNVQHLSGADLRAGVQVTRRVVNEVSRITVSGISWNGSTSSEYISTVPGKVFKTHGRPDSIPNLAIANQTQADRLALLALANRNNPFPQVAFGLAGINRLIDIAPAMYVTLDLTDNPRGLDLDRLPVLPKRVSYTYDQATGVFLVDVSGEGYTDEETRLEGDPPGMAFSF
jgi:hypothetical protein